MDLDAFDDDAWWAIAGVGAGYGLALLGILVLLFLLPYLVFTTL